MIVHSTFDPVKLVFQLSSLPLSIVKAELHKHLYYCPLDAATSFNLSLGSSPPWILSSRMV